MIDLCARQTQTGRLAAVVLASLIGLLVTSCSDEGDPVAADDAVCATVLEVGQDFLSDSGPNDPLAELAEAAGKGSVVARLAHEMNDLAQQDQLSAEDAERFTQLGSALDEELEKACPDLARRRDR